MKIDALDHPKTIALSAELKISLPQTIGHLELLWAFVSQKTPQGNIGKWPNSVISHSAQWDGDPDIFVNALVKVGFCDECQEHRLLIHDWNDHMPNWVRAKLSRAKLPIFDLSADLSADYKGSQGKSSEEKENNKFIPPTLKEVSDYCKERGNSINPATFIDHYTANGWIRGKTKIKDWKACVRTWEQNKGNGNAKPKHDGKTALERFEESLGTSMEGGELDIR